MSVHPVLNDYLKKVLAGIRPLLLRVSMGATLPIVHYLWLSSPVVSIGCLSRPFTVVVTLLHM